MYPLCISRDCEVYLLQEENGQLVLIVLYYFVSGIMSAEDCVPGNKLGNKVKHNTMTHTHVVDGFTGEDVTAGK